MQELVVTLLTGLAGGGAFGVLVGKLWDRSASKKDIVFKEKKDLYLAFIGACVTSSGEMSRKCLDIQKKVFNKQSIEDEEPQTDTNHKLQEISSKMDIFAGKGVIGYYPAIMLHFYFMDGLISEQRRLAAEISSLEYDAAKTDILHQRLTVTMVNFQTWQARYNHLIDSLKYQMRRDLSGYWSLFERGNALKPFAPLVATADRLMLPMDWLGDSSVWAQKMRELVADEKRTGKRPF